MNAAGLRRAGRSAFACALLAAAAACGERRPAPPLQRAFALAAGQRAQAHVPIREPGPYALQLADP